MIARTWSAWSSTPRKLSSVSTSESLMPSPHCSTKARSAMPEIGTTMVKTSHSATIAERDPLPAAERQQLLSRRLALHRDVLAGALEQPPLQQHQRERDRDDAHRHRGHEVIRRRSELVRQLEEIGGQHEMAFRVAEHERQAEQLEAEEEDEHRGVEERRHRHRAGSR